ncbi:hypothetical protein BDQ94DRAFT_136170 [Aspergillus welwitschiae]|uniref:Uncharacterized protein n=1 Tax=Aspergillus welwitschiae TaxID=1341132 RepID=A0A3F3QF86_9EURO|nr:hypothetical protein BDQ94DRAFT_136170 [Aspergillus welwitschiae]RDH37316.1 hypothetical protein BDQ94DRAFT_136170 [Aspergillus welwitschiae]
MMVLQSNQLLTSSFLIESRALCWVAVYIGVFALVGVQRLAVSIQAYATFAVSCKTSI